MITLNNSPGLTISPQLVYQHNHCQTQQLLFTQAGQHLPHWNMYITNNAPEYLEVWGEFFKQWHYSMNLTKCEDPQTYWQSEEALNYPTNSFYPPGTVCAVERLKEFCPTSGESGSPLMVTDDEGRMVVEGIHSFTKVLKICSPS